MFEIQDFRHDSRKGGSLLRNIGNERGMTLLEVLVTMTIIVVTILSIYIGVVYAEKQVLRNYRDRVASLYATGELDYQYSLYNANKSLGDLRPITKTVTLDYLPKNKVLSADVNVDVIPMAEAYNSLVLNYMRVKVTVKWYEAGDDRVRSIVMVEDFYN